MAFPCTPPPPGQCVVPQPGCIYPAEYVPCGSHAVPAVSGWAIGALVIILAVVALRQRKLSRGQRIGYPRCIGDE